MARDDFDDDGTVTISKEEYDQLIEDSRFLENLRDAGVDNWEGYHYGFGGGE